QARSGGNRGPRRGSGGGGDRRQRGQHVGLGGPSVLARGLDGGGGDALLVGELARGRAGGGEIGAARGSQHRRGRRQRGSGRRGRRGSRRSNLGRRRRRGSGGRPGRGAGGTGLDVAQQATHRDGGAFRDREIDDGAGHGGIDLDRDLVGLELAQGLVDGDLVARLHQPLGHRRLGDRFTEGRNLDLDRHDLLLRRSFSRSSTRGRRDRPVLSDGCAPSPSPATPI